jgi:hypothetical protein
MGVDRLGGGCTDLYVNYVPACTYEGDNVVMCFQTARYLIKAARGAAKGQPLRTPLISSPLPAKAYSAHSYEWCGQCAVSGSIAFASSQVSGAEGGGLYGARHDVGRRLCPPRTLLRTRRRFPLRALPLLTTSK